MFWKLSTHKEQVWYRLCDGNQDKNFAGRRAVEDKHNARRSVHIEA